MNKYLLTLALLASTSASFAAQVRSCTANTETPAALVAPAPSVYALISTSSSGAHPFCKLLSGMKPAGAAAYNGYANTSLDGKQWAKVQDVLSSAAPVVPVQCPAGCVQAAASSSSSGGESSSSSGIPAPPVVPAPPVTPAPQYKSHPGHYVWLDPNSGQAAQMAAIDTLSAETAVQGVQLLVNWAALEGDTPGNYAAGFALMDSYLARLAAQKTPKRLLFGVQERKFGIPQPLGTPCTKAAKGLLPAYVPCTVAAPNAAGALSVMANFWTPAVMDRLIALSQAYGARYDGNPLLEMFWGNGETAVAAPPGSGFSNAAYAAQLERWFDASIKAWPHTRIRLVANYLGTNDQMLALIKYATASGGVVVGGPDPELPLPISTRTIQANRLFRGLDGGADLRGKVLWVGEVQGMGLGDKYTQAPAQIWAYDSGTMHASYMVWYQNGYLGSVAQRWSTGILPYIRSINGATTAKP